MTDRRAIIAVLLVAAVALGYQAWFLSVTADEPSHMLSSYLYWRGRDTLYPRDMPPMIKLVGGWPTRFMKLPIDTDLGKPGDKRTEWNEAASLMNRLPAEKLQRFLFWTRLPLIIFPLLTGALLWWWGRELVSPWTAVLIAGLWVFSPVPMGHGALFKNDHAAAFTHLLFWYSAWRYWRSPDRRNVMLLGSAGALAAASKLSLLYLPALAPLIVLLRARTVWHLVSVTLVPYAIALLLWQFDLHWTSPTELAALARDRVIPGWFASFSHVFRLIPIPDGLWVGVVSLIRSNAAAVPVYMLGQVYPEGSHFYFLLATMLKMPFPLWIATVVGLVLAIRQRRSLFVIVPGLLYFALASASSLQLGVRLVFPAWAMFLLLAAFAIDLLWSTPWRRAILVGGFAMILTGMLITFPNGIAYFNSFTGSPHEQLRYLADSNIDWGQGLRQAALWAKYNGVQKLRFSYFGFDQPRRFFDGIQVELVAPPWNDRVARGVVLQPEPGWYAISSTLLPGHFFQSKYRDYYSAFLRRKPQGMSGSIFFYRVD